MTSFKKDRFDLEQAIMNAWATGEDLDLVYHNTDNLNLSPKDCDTIQNQLLGLKYLFELRMEKVWSIFGTMFPRLLVFYNPRGNIDSTFKHWNTSIRPCRKNIILFRFMRSGDNFGYSMFK